MGRVLLGTDEVLVMRHFGQSWQLTFSAISSIVEVQHKATVLAVKMLG